MHILKGIAAFSSLIIISCGHLGHDMSDSDTSPIGTWSSEAALQDGMAGHNVNTTIKTTVIIDQQRFRISAESKSSGMGTEVLIPVYERVGTWAMHNDTIRFSPDTCKVYDPANSAMVVSDTCRTDMMRGMIDHGGMLTLYGMSMMENDTATIACTRK